jgi:hypothetical protein
VIADRVVVGRGFMEQKLAQIKVQIKSQIKVQKRDE